MKKILFTASLLICGNCHSDASATEIRPKTFKGVYAGLGGGYNFSEFDLTIRPNHLGKFAGSGIVGGGIIGCGTLLGESNFYVGLEGTLSKSSTVSKSYQNIQFINRHLKFRENGPTFGIDLMAGYVYGGVLPYLKVGINSTNWKTTTRWTVTGMQFLTTGKYKKRLRGLSIGLGGLLPITSNLFCGAEFVHTNYGSQKIREVVLGLNTAYKIKPRTNEFLFKVVYKII